MLAFLPLFYRAYALCILFLSPTLSGASHPSFTLPSQPGSVKKINQSTMIFKQMENISLFLAACRSLGVPSFDCFETNDLFQGMLISLLPSFVLAHSPSFRFQNFTQPLLYFFFLSPSPSSIEKNVQGVLRCLDSLGRTVQTNCPSFPGPHIGAKMATKNSISLPPSLLPTPTQKRMCKASSAAWTRSGAPCKPTVPPSQARISEPRWPPKTNVISILPC